ncbi:hypothetical protein ACFLXG_02630 [Chloroflexota bacterium]
MDADWILRIVLFGIVHWILAGVLLPDLVSRQKVFGERKAPWAVVIIIIPCFGSVLYLLFHPQIFNPDNSQYERRHQGRDKKD